MLTTSWHARDGLGWTRRSWAFQNALIYHHRGPTCQVTTPRPTYLMQNVENEKNALHHGVLTKNSKTQFLFYQKIIARLVCSFFCQDSEYGLGIEFWYRQIECRLKPHLTLRANPAVPILETEAAAAQRVHMWIKLMLIDANDITVIVRRHWVVACEYLFDTFFCLHTISESDIFPITTCVEQNRLDIFLHVASDCSLTLVIIGYPVYPKKWC